MRAISTLVLALICLAAGIGAGYELALVNEHQRLERNKLLIRLSHEKVWSERDNATATRVAREIYVPGFVDHTPEGDSTGLNDFIKGIEENRGNFPDWTERVDAIVAEGDLVAARFTSSGTQARDLRAIPRSQPTIPNKGRVLHMPAIEIFRVSQGRLAEQWDITDGWNANAQLGLYDPDHWRESVCGNKP